MRRFVHIGLFLTGLASPLLLCGQGIKVTSDDGSPLLSLEDLRQAQIVVPGLGREIPGIDLEEEEGDARHALGDDTAFAERDYMDRLWAFLKDSRDSVLPGSSIHWVRYHVTPAAELKGVRMLLQLSATVPFEAFLNGRLIVGSPGLSGAPKNSGMPLMDSLPRMAVPFVFACDGTAEVIAIRLQGESGVSLQATDLAATLHTASGAYLAQRHVMHLGVFIGVNVIILLLALIIWMNERREQSWLLLALLAAVSALDTFCELGVESGALGYEPSITAGLRIVSIIITPWPMYLMVMVLGLLHGGLSPKRARWYTIMAVVITLICALFALGEVNGVLDGSDGLEVVKDDPWLIALTIGLAVVFVIGVIWFFVEWVRLGVRLLRTKGYARWVGGGALVSSLLASVLGLFGGLAGSGQSSWLAVIGDYCSYIAVPVSVAVFLAIRSAHHNRLVARQRDELDEEVKQRTAQLSAEKERSEELLLNILPYEVAEELKRTGAAEARHFDQATVMFTDFKGFTSMSERVTPAELLQELNTCFKAFDDIIGARGIEKIKTIGDAYMAAGGLPDPGTSTPSEVVHAALEMQAFMQRRARERQALGLPAFEMRVGIHTGPVVAGIVGVKKFQYDIWGDTVNTASRMESSGEVGQVNISEATYAVVKDTVVNSQLSVASAELSGHSRTTDNQQLTTTPAFIFTPRGKVEAKGKGAMEMYFVERAG